MASLSTVPDSTRTRSTWITPSGVLSPPSGGNGRLVRCAVNEVLSLLTLPDNSDGARPPKVRRSCERTRVSLTNRPSS